MNVKRITPVLFVKDIETVLPFWVDALGFAKAIEVPHGDKLGFVALQKGNTEVMYQSFASLGEDMPLIAEAARKGPTFLYIEVDNLDAVLAALKGKLTIKTEHDANSVDVPEGSAVRITLVDPSEPQGGAEPAGRAAPAIKKLALIVFLFAAAFLAIFLWIAAHEPSETPQQLASEVSPFKVQ